MKSVLPKNNITTASILTGNAWANLLVQPADALNLIVKEATFEAKARTHWHSHPHGKVMVITNGVGYYQEKGKAIRVIRKGEVVQLPKDVEHWHGASHESQLEYTAIIPAVASGTTWAKPVTDAEYDAIQAKAVAKKH